VVAFRKWVALAALLTVGCSKSPESLGATRPAAALEVATAYAKSHNPAGAFRPDGSAFEYHVADAGAAWKVEIQPVGQMGGGLEVVVRKQDLSVISALRTQ
jgi:hypothetical protein